MKVEVQAAFKVQIDWKGSKPVKLRMFQNVYIELSFLIILNQFKIEFPNLYKLRLYN